jgi:hypothetical protein
MDHRFVRSRVAQFFAGEPFDGFGIVAQRVHFGPELLGDLFLLLQFGIEVIQLGAHPFVFVNEGQIGHANKNQYRKDDEDDDRLRELAPDAEINFHAISLTAHRLKVKAVFIVTAQKMVNVAPG